MAGTLGVLLAGGQGERLGLGVPKALVRLGGLTLLERACATLEPACDEIVVVAPASMELPIESALRVNDIAGAEGPLAGVVAGLGARSFAHAIVLGIDFPAITGGALAALLRWLESSGAAAVVPRPGGTPQPLVAAYRPAASLALAAALERGERSITRAVSALDPLWLDDQALEHLEGGRESFRDLDTPDDLAFFERRLAAAAERR